VKRIFAVALGILTAIGGFLDIGDIVTNAVVGSRFGWSLAWVVVVGVAGICVFAQMSGRVAAVSGRATFEVIRERLGPRLALANLAASFLINLLTLTAEVGGIALALQLASSIHYLLWIPVAAFAVWLMIWRVGFDVMENVTGMVGLLLIGFAVAFFMLGPDWGALGQQVVQAMPSSEAPATYWFYAVALFGAALTPYEVFFFSSGAVEDHWTPKDLMVNRLNVYLGFPLGGILSLAIMGAAAVVFEPHGVSLSHLSQVTLPVSLAFGKIGLVLLLYGMFAAIFSAALETALSAGYTMSQFFGWQWGTFVKPREAARFHLVVVGSIVVGVLIALTTIDPILITEYSIVLAAAALPLTYLPILIVANDPMYMKDKVNSRPLNAIAFVFFVLLVIVSVATIPLMIITKAGA